MSGTRRERPTEDVPRTLTWIPGDDVTQRPVFEPALKQYQNAYRATDPVFTDPARGGDWRTARRRALHLVLAAIAGSQWSESLVLRGSLLMSLWFGEAAREPGDLDFVVVPADRGIDEPRTDRMIRGIAQAAQAQGGDIRFSARDAVVEDIWTYERAPGRRMVLTDVVAAARHVEWEHFVTEYPQFTDRGREFADRLVHAVTPAFPPEAR
ncbi:nucleotidyl transferase AbiEii/AbiGii toxin family protein [Streptomyces sp. NPDC001709]